MASDDNQNVTTDELITSITNYVCNDLAVTDKALTTARFCLLDSLGCAYAALEQAECRAHLGPIVPNAKLVNGAKVIATGVQLDPVKTAFDNGVLIRWLDYNDTWLAAEWGHPSDNLGGLLAISDYLGRNPKVLKNTPEVSMAKLLQYSIQAHEIQGVLALKNSFNQVGLDHVLLVKLATAALVAKITGGQNAEVASAISHAFIDGHSLRTYRHAPNTSQRKSWAAGDATSRGVRLGLMTTQAGLKQLSSAITAPKWGFSDVLFNGKAPVLERELACYVMENILFKVSFPAEFHAQTAAEAAIKLHNEVINNIDDISKIEIKTQESAVRIISKTGELRNFADRDHCLQYIVAVALLEGDLTAEHYLDDYAQNPKIDKLRNLMEVTADDEFSKDYLDPNKRTIANAIKIHFNDGSSTDFVTVEYPIGHVARREEAKPLLIDKFIQASSKHIGQENSEKLVDLIINDDNFLNMPVNKLLDLTTIND